MARCVDSVLCTVMLAVSGDLPSAIHRTSADIYILMLKRLIYDRLREIKIYRFSYRGQSLF